MPQELSEKLELLQKELSKKAGKYVSKSSLIVEIIDHFFIISDKEGKGLQSKSRGV